MLVFVGKIENIFEKVKKTETFSVHEFRVSQENSFYPNKILFQASDGASPVLDGLQVGDRVEVHFAIKGKEYIDKNGVQKFTSSLKAHFLKKL